VSVCVLDILLYSGFRYFIFSFCALTLADGWPPRFMNLLRVENGVSDETDENGENAENHESS
jgi:hypothetical protein